jgi:hypothetical protein
MMNEIYMWVSSGALVALGLTWRKSDTLNLMIKLALVGLGVWGLYIQFQ